MCKFTPQTPRRVLLFSWLNRSTDKKRENYEKVRRYKEQLKVKLEQEEGSDWRQVHVRRYRSRDEDTETGTVMNAQNTLINLSYSCIN